MGIETVTMQNLKVVKVDAEKNIILVSGSLPGAIGTTVFLRTASKSVASETTQKAGA
jgi:large subunit ribosomal protein L3